MNAKKSLEQIKAYQDNLEKAKKLQLAVGLPKETASSKVYGDGTSVIKVGAMHEYGAGKIPRRSFLRTPFIMKDKEISNFLLDMFKRVAEKGLDAEKALSIVGVKAVNISQGAFTSKGYGTWQALKQSTINEKGSSQILIDTGTLRSSITYIVRDANAS